MIVLDADATTRPQVETPAPDQLPPELLRVLELAVQDGNTETVSRLLGYALRAQPGAAAQIEALRQTHARAVERRKQATADAARAMRARRSILHNWDGQFEFGASWTSGVSSSIGVLGAVSAERKGLRWSHKILVRGELQDTDGSRTVERVLAAWQPSRQIADGAYTFALTQYERDPALGYQNRYSAGLGAGLKWGGADRLQVALEGGPAVRRTTGATSYSSIAARGSADLTWPLSEKLLVRQKIAAFYEDGQTNGQLSSAVDTKVSERLKLRVSYDFRYEERAAQTTGSAARASLIVVL